MTTFIDFRYTGLLASAMFTKHDQEETTITVTPGKDNYLAVEFASTPCPRDLLALTSENGKRQVVVRLRPDGALCLEDRTGKILLRTPPKVVRTPPQVVTPPKMVPPSAVARGPDRQILGIRLGDTYSGFKLDGTVYENQVSAFSKDTSELPVHFDDESAVRVMGRGTGRAERWAKLMYHRGEPRGLRVEVVTDWHHLCTGIPFYGTMTAETFIEHGDFRLQLRSYAYSRDDARKTDFVRMFGSEESSDVSVHIMPALYTGGQVARRIPRIGYFVTETMNPHPHLVNCGNRMDSLCVPSSFARDAFKKNGVFRPMRIIPHGVDLEYYRPVTHKQPLPGGRGFNFLATATHLERKNMKHVVRAFLEEFREHEDVALYLLLRPEYHATQNNVALEFTEWERLYARRSAPILLWTGYTTRERLRYLYANANAYVMPSNEGFGLTLLEAMACGTPVIGLDHGGVLDFLNPATGYLVPTGRSFIARDVDSMPYIGDRFFEPDVRRLRAIMRHVFENESEARERARRARKNCEEHFNWEKSAEEFARLIEETAAAAGESPRENTMKPVSSEAPPAVSWILCILDATPVRKTLRYLKNKNKRASILCLFTRYSRVSDILRARKHGYLFYRWDGSRNNCEVIATSLLGTGWKGILYPGERIDGDEEQLTSFLASQPDSVTRVSVPCSGGREEQRFFRTASPDAAPSDVVPRDTAPQTTTPREVRYAAISIHR